MFTEFFCGIGGLSAVLGQQKAAVSIDINQNALAIHQLNHPHGQLCKTIESLKSTDLNEAANHFWWMSPPCQPFTRRGKQQDLDDERMQGFRRVLQLVGQIRPQHLAMENVPQFSGSRAHTALQDVLNESGYVCEHQVLCPTDLGQAGSLNRRKRFYLWASLRGEKFQLSLRTPTRHSAWLQDDLNFQDFAVPDSLCRQYADAIHVISEEDFLSGAATTRCFTSAYGRSPVFSGSYLQTNSGVRRFTPSEVIRQLGFPDWFRLPAWPARRLWPLVGNSLSLHAVAFVLNRLASSHCRQ